MWLLKQSFQIIHRASIWQGNLTYHTYLRVKWQIKLKYLHRVVVNMYILLSTIIWVVRLCCGLEFACFKFWVPSHHVTCSSHIEGLCTQYVVQKVGSAGSQVCSHLIRGLCTMDFVPGFDACTSASCQGLLCTLPSYFILVTHMIRTSNPPVTHASYLQCTSSVLHLYPIL